MTNNPTRSARKASIRVFGPTQDPCHAVPEIEGTVTQARQMSTTFSRYDSLVSYGDPFDLAEFRVFQRGREIPGDTPPDAAGYPGSHH